MTEGVFRHKDIKIDYARILLHPSPTGAPSRREPSFDLCARPRCSHKPVGERLGAPAGERSSPLPDDTKNVSVSQKTAGASPRPTAKLIILCFLLLFGTILSKSLHLEGKVSTRASVASDAVDG